MSLPSSQSKSEWRTYARTIVPSANRYREASSEICARLENSPYFQEAQTIFTYLPAFPEPDILPVIAKYLHQKTFATWDGHEGITTFETLENLKRKNHVPVPTPLHPLLSDLQFDLILVPGVLFDEEDYRLGHGTGWYDRFLEKQSGYKLGLTLREYLVPNLPRASHDQPIDLLLCA